MAYVGICTPEQYKTALGLKTIDPLLTMLMPMVENIVIDFLRYDPVKRANIEYYPLNAQRVSAWSGPLMVDSRNGKAFLTPTTYSYGDMLFLRNTPVWNDDTFEIREQFGGKSGQEAGSFGTSTILVKGVDYWIDVSGSGQISTSGIVYRNGTLWSQEPGSIKVTYNGGYTSSQLNGSTPTDPVRVAAIQLGCVIAMMFNYRQMVLNQKVSDLIGFAAGPITSESIGPYSYSAAAAGGVYDFQAALPSASMKVLQPHRSYRGLY